MFNKAKALKNPVAETKGKKKERDLRPLAGCEQLAHLDAVIKTATAAKETLQNGLSEQVREIFMEKLQKNGGQQPESFYGTEGLAEVNCQLRKRGTNSALNEDERKVFDEAKIPYHKEVITPELFAINPAYATDKKLLERVEKALAKLDLPEDFIVLQEERHKYVVDDECLAKALKSDNQEVVKVATTVAFRPALTEMKPDEIAKTVEELLGIEKEEPEAEAEVKEEKPAKAKRATKK